jgi:hypothetical protein
VSRRVHSRHFAVHGSHLHGKTAQQNITSKVSIQYVECYTPRSTAHRVSRHTLHNTYTYTYTYTYRPAGKEVAPSPQSHPQRQDQKSPKKKEKKFFSLFFVEASSSCKPFQSYVVTSLTLGTTGRRRIVERWGLTPDVSLQ